MEEASIVSEQHIYHPKNVMQHLSSNNSNDCHTRHEKDDAKKGMKRSHEEIHNNEESNLKPEYFQDWRFGGNTQKNSESQSQFALTATSVM